MFLDGFCSCEITLAIDIGRQLTLQHAPPIASFETPDRFGHHKFAGRDDGHLKVLCHFGQRENFIHGGAPRAARAFVSVRVWPATPAHGAP